MGYFSQETIDTVQSRADIVEVINGYVPLTARGQDYWGCCPFHHEKTPSFKVNPALQSYYCFGCQKSGNVFTFIQEKENIDFVSAVRMLMQRYNIVAQEVVSNSEERQKSQRKEAVFSVLEQVANWYQEQLKSEAAIPATHYLINRGLDRHWCETFTLGYSPERGLIDWARQHHLKSEILVDAGLISLRENTPTPQYYERFRDRLMFPIRDELGRVVGFSARTLKQDPKMAKYINTAETIVFKKNRILYGLNMARKSFKDKGFALVCEGQLDVIACFRTGLVNAVCSQGTAFTEQHAALLHRFTKDVVFCFDSDKAGIKATIRSIQLAIKNNLGCRVAVLPEGEDPDSLLKNKGAEALRVVVDQAKEALEFLFDYACQQFDVRLPEGKNKISEILLPVIAMTQSPIMQTAQFQWFADKLSLPLEAIIASFKKLESQENREEYPPASSYANNDSKQVTKERFRNNAETTSTHSYVHKNRTQYVFNPSLKTQEVDVTIETEKMLLDLALSSEPAAILITEQLDSQKISSNPVGIALNLVLAEVQFGDWKMAKEQLIRDEKLIRDPLVGKVLMQPQFNADEHQEEYFNKIVVKAISDCAKAINLQYIDRRLKEIKQQLTSEADEGVQNQLMVEYTQLAQSRREL